MFAILALITAVFLGTTITATVALVFLFREMSAYVHQRALEIARTRNTERIHNQAQAWGDWSN